MRVKLYRAGNMRDAIGLVRDELGADALILGTRRISGGIEVTAALDGASEPEAVAEPARGPIFADHRLPEAISRKLAAGPLPFAVAAVFKFARLDLTAASRPLLLVGPPGGGKTLTTARIATRLVLSGVKPMVLTADSRRAGAVEQLAAFTRLLGIELLSVDGPKSLRKAIAARPDNAPALIDAPGLNPFDPTQGDEIQSLAQAVDANAALVLPAGLDTAEAADIAAGHFRLGVKLLIATRLDLVWRLGGILAAADAGLAMAEAGVGPGAVDSLKPMTPAWLAARLLQHGHPTERSS